jgi:hypothetical protein
MASRIYLFLPGAKAERQKNRELKRDQINADQGDPWLNEQ